MDFKNRVIDSGWTLLDTLKKMDVLDKKLLIVMDSDKFTGLISVGDIQRSLINNLPLDSNVSRVMRHNIRIARPADSIDEIRQMMLTHRMELCPVVNESNEITSIYFWEDLFLEKKPKPKNQFQMPVIIMAGGLGTRLKPLTNVIPKPLIPIGEKTILEEIFQRFGDHGCTDFFISVNYKSELIEFYLNNCNLPYQLEFFKETRPLGTAGSLSLIREKITETCFVSNCDILIEQDYSEILEYHRNNGNEITLVAALKHYPIPYGILETGSNGQLIRLQEKPEMTFKINSGMYILEPEVLQEIPFDTHYHITQLIDKIILRKGKVGVFPVSEGSWKDIGDWNLYLNENIKSFV